MALAMPPPVSPTGAGSLVKKFQFRLLRAVHEQIAQDEEQRSRREQRAQAGEGQHHGVHGLAAELCAGRVMLMPCTCRAAMISRRADAVDHDGEREQHQAQFDQARWYRGRRWLR